MNSRVWKPGSEERISITYDPYEKFKEYRGYIVIIILFYICEVTLFRETETFKFI